MDIEKELAKYLRGELVKERSKESPLIKFALRHAQPGSKGNDVESWDVAGEKIDLDDLPRMAGDILGRAQTDADGLGNGIQRYVVQSILKGGKSGTRFVLRLRATDEDLEEGGEDSPTIKGLLSQMMRHNEAYARAMSTSVGSMMSMMVRRMESMDEQMTRMIEERSQTFLALEAAKSQQHDRDMEAMEVMESNKRKDVAFTKMMALVPVVVNRFAGQKLLPEKSDPLLMMMEQLVGSMTQEQFQSIAASLSPEQTITFVEILKTFQTRNGAQKEN